MSTTSVSGSGAITVTLDEKIYAGPVSVDTHGASVTLDIPSFLAGTPAPTLPSAPSASSVDSVKNPVLGTVNSVAGGASIGLQGVLQSVTGGASDALLAIKGALPSVPGVGGLPQHTQSSSVGAVSLVEDASKSLLVSFKDTNSH